MFNTLTWLRSLIIFFLFCSVSYAQSIPPTRLQDEGTTLGPVFILNCVGAGVNCTRSGVTGTLTISGSGGGSGTPGGADTNIQFNNVGVFGGSTAFTFNTGTGLVNISTGLTVGTNLTLSGVAASRFLSLNSSNIVSPTGSSSALASSITDESGTGQLVLNNGATMTSLTAKTLLTADNILDSGISASRFLTSDASKNITSTNNSAALANTLTDSTGSPNGGVAVFNNLPTMTGPTFRNSFIFSNSSNIMTGNSGGIQIYKDEQILGNFLGNTGTMTSLVIKNNLTLNNPLSLANGGTDNSSASDDNMLISNGTVWQTKALSDCQDSGGNHMNYTASSNSWSCGTSGGAGGGVTSVTGSRPVLVNGTTTPIISLDSTGSGVATLNNNPTMTNIIVENRFTFRNTGSTNIMTGTTGGMQINNDLQVVGNLLGNTGKMTSLITGTQFAAQQNFAIQTATQAPLMTAASSGILMTVEHVGINNLTPTAKLSLRGTTDEVQFDMTGWNTQSNNLFNFKNFLGNSEFSGDASGNITTNGTITSGGSGQSSIGAGVVINSSAATTANGGDMVYKNTSGVPAITWTSSTGFVTYSGASPVLSSCGTTPSVRGTDNAFEITFGSGAGGCTATFANAKTNAPVCTATEQALSLVNSLSYTVSATAVTLTEASSGGLLVDVICAGK